MRAAIFSGDALLDGDGKLRTIDSMLDEVKATPQMKGMSLYDEVSTKPIPSNPAANSKARNRCLPWRPSIWASSP